MKKTNGRNWRNCAVTTKRFPVLRICVHFADHTHTKMVSNETTSDEPSASAPQPMPLSHYTEDTAPLLHDQALLELQAANATVVDGIRSVIPELRANAAECAPDAVEQRAEELAALKVVCLEQERSVQRLRVEVQRLQERKKERREEAECLRQGEQSFDMNKCPSMDKGNVYKCVTTHNSRQENHPERDSRSSRADHLQVPPAVAVTQSGHACAAAADDDDSGWRARDGRATVEVAVHVRKAVRAGAAVQRCGRDVRV